MKKVIFILALSFATTLLAKANEISGVATESTRFTPTPLCNAISKGETELVKKFIEYGADINETSNGLTPLMMAARYNNVEILKILVEKGCNQKTKSDNGFTALQWAEAAGAKEAVEFLRSTKK